MRRRKKSGAPLAPVVSGVLSAIQRQGRPGREEMMEVWAEAAGRAAAHASPASLQKGILRVHVDSSGWLQELDFNRRRILKKLQSRFGKDRISGIRFRIG